MAVNNPVLRHLGKISYGLYIYHCLIFWSFRVSPLHLKIVLWEHHYWGDLAIVAIDFGLAYGVTLLSWYLIETPILDLKRFFKSPAASAGGEQSSPEQINSAVAAGS